MKLSLNFKRLTMLLIAASGLLTVTMFAYKQVHVNTYHIELNNNTPLMAIALPAGKFTHPTIVKPIGGKLAPGQQNLQNEWRIAKSRHAPLHTKMNLYLFNKNGSLAARLGSFNVIASTTASSIKLNNPPGMKAGSKYQVNFRIKNENTLAVSIDPTHKKHH